MSSRQMPLRMGREKDSPLYACGKNFQWHLSKCLRDTSASIQGMNPVCMLSILVIFVILSAMQ